MATAIRRGVVVLLIVIFSTVYQNKANTRNSYQSGELFIFFFILFFSRKRIWPSKRVIFEIRQMYCDTLISSKIKTKQLGCYGIELATSISRKKARTHLLNKFVITCKKLHENPDSIASKWSGIVTRARTMILTELFDHAITYVLYNKTAKSDFAYKSLIIICKIPKPSKHSFIWVCRRYT